MRCGPVPAWPWAPGHGQPAPASPQLGVRSPSGQLTGALSTPDLSQSQRGVASIPRQGYPVLPYAGVGSAANGTVVPLTTQWRPQKTSQQVRPAASSSAQLVKGDSTAGAAVSVATANEIPLLTPRVKSEGASASVAAPNDTTRLTPRLGEAHPAVAFSRPIGKLEEGNDEAAAPMELVDVPVAIGAAQNIVAVQYCSAVVAPAQPATERGPAAEPQEAAKQSDNTPSVESRSQRPAASPVDCSPGQPLAELEAEVSSLRSELDSLRAVLEDEHRQKLKAQASCTEAVLKVDTLERAVQELEALLVQRDTEVEKLQAEIFESRASRNPQSAGTEMFPMQHSGERREPWPSWCGELKLEVDALRIACEDAVEICAERAATTGSEKALLETRHAMEYLQGDVRALRDRHLRLVDALSNGSCLKDSLGSDSVVDKPFPEAGRPCDDALELQNSVKRDPLMTPRRQPGRGRPASPQTKRPPSPRRLPSPQTNRQTPRQGETAASAVQGDEIDEHWCKVLRKFSNCSHWALVKEKRGVYRMGNASGRRLRCAVVHGHLQVQTDHGFLGAEAFLRRYGAAEMGPGQPKSPASKARQPLSPASKHRAPPSPVQTGVSPAKSLARVDNDLPHDVAMRSEVAEQMQEIAALRAENAFLSRLSQSAAASVAVSVASGGLQEPPSCIDLANPDEVENAGSVLVATGPGDDVEMIRGDME